MDCTEGHIMASKTEHEEVCQMMETGGSEASEGEIACEENIQEKEKWSSHLDYILAMIGGIVGLGNLWRFPYVCNRNGGGAFLIPFFIFLFALAFPIFSLEASLGQFSGQNAVRVWSFCPILKGAGIAAVMMTSVFASYYTVLVAWPIYYMIQSCSAILPWTTCDNSWNTPLCIEDIANNGTNITAFGNESAIIPRAELWKNKSLAHTSVEEFWQYNVLNISRGIHELGSVQWHLVGCNFAVIVIVILCLSRGVKSLGKVVYVTALLPYILLVVIFIKSMTQEGAIDGILYYVWPDFSKLLTVQVWLEALIQVFYSLAVGWGIIYTTTCHNKFHEPCIRDSFILAMISEGTSLFGGFVTFSVLGVMSERTSIPISEVVSSGPGLAYVVYPAALSQLPLPQLWSFLFFLMLFSVGLDSQFLNIELIVAVLSDGFPQFFRKRRFIGLCTICLTCFLLGVIYCTQAGPYILQVVDWYVACYSVFVVCILECTATAWFYGMKQINYDIRLMTGKSPPVLLRFLWAIFVPVTLLVGLILTLVQYQPPTYGKYKYPITAIVFGWIIASVSLIPLSVCAVVAVRKQLMTSKSIIKGIMSATRPDRSWKPACEQYREKHRESLLLADRPFFSKLKDIFWN